MMAEERKGAEPWRADFRPGGAIPPHMMPPRSEFGTQKDDWLMDGVERYWLIPCVNTLPELCHGLCNVLPCMFVGLAIVGVVALLKWREERAARLSEEAKQSAGKKKD